MTDVKRLYTILLTTSTATWLTLGCTAPTRTESEAKTAPPPSRPTPEALASAVSVEKPPPFMASAREARSIECLSDPSVVTQDALVVRSFNLHAIAGRRADDFAEAVRIAHAELGHAGAIWNLQETASKALCNAPTLECLEQRVARVTGATSVASLQGPEDPSSIAGNPWRFSWGKSVGAGLYRVHLVHEAKKWTIRIYNIHGWVNCDSDHAAKRRTEIEDVIADLRHFPPTEEFPPIFLGDFNANPPDLGGCAEDIKQGTYTLLREHFSQILPAPWNETRLTECGIDTSLKSIDQIWVARADVYKTSGRLQPIYASRIAMSDPSTPYCQQRKAEAKCDGGHPEIPCSYCLSDHPLLTAAFSMSCTPTCDVGACGSDGCGGTCPCGANMNCVRNKCRAPGLPFCPNPGHLWCECCNGCMSANACRTSCESGGCGP